MTAAPASSAHAVDIAAGPPPGVTVAICTRNRSRFLRLAVESVLGQARPEAEVLIVDNASTDDTATLAAEFARRHPNVRVWREEEPGLSAARNAALRRARGEYVIFLDDDAIAEPGWLSSYVDFCRKPPAGKLGGIGGPVHPYYDVALPGWMHPDAHKLDWSKELQPYVEGGRPWGCNFAMHREQAITLGGFDTRLGRKGAGMGAHEESDLFDKLKLAGWEIWWLPSAPIRHHVAAQRLTFRAQCRGSFADGRSAALYRLHLKAKGLDQILFRAGRMLAAPFQSLVCLLAALFVVPVPPSHRAASLVFRAARSAGIGWQMVVGAGKS